MNNKPTTVTIIARSIIHKIVQKEIDKWPPDCGTILYQVHRPLLPEHKTNTDTSNN